MPRFEDGSYSSKAGIALIAKVLAGRCQMHYTRAAVGKGAIPEGMSPKTMTEPAGYVMDAKIAAVGNPVDGECQVSVQINSNDVETGFHATGVLLYAADPDLGEVPYTYLVLEDEPERIRPKSAAVGKLATFDLIAAVDEIDRVTATIDPDAVMTYKAVEQLILGATAQKDIIIPTTGWVDSRGTQNPGGAGGGEEPTEEPSEETEESVDPIEPGGPGESGGTDEPDGLYIDIPVLEATERTPAMLSVMVRDSEAARACGLAPTCKTMEGAVRLYAEKDPTSEIKASLTLFGVVSRVVEQVSTHVGGNASREE